MSTFVTILSKISFVALVYWIRQWIWK